MQNISKNKKGFIVISQMVQNDHQTMFELLKVFVPVAIQPVHSLGGLVTFRYYGFCNQFDETSDLLSAPEYDIVFERTDNNTNVVLRSIQKTKYEYTIV